MCWSRSNCWKVSDTRTGFDRRGCSSPTRCNWRPLFDPDYDPAQPTKFSPGAVPAPVQELYQEVIPKVLAPMDRVDASGKPDVGAAGQVDILWLKKRLDGLRAKPKRNTVLYVTNPKTNIDFATKK